MPSWLIESNCECEPRITKFHDASYDVRCDVRSNCETTRQESETTNNGQVPQRLIEYYVSCEISISINVVLPVSGETGRGRKFRMV